MYDDDELDFADVVGLLGPAEPPVPWGPGALAWWFDWTIPDPWSDGKVSLEKPPF